MLLLGCSSSRYESMKLLGVETFSENRFKPILQDTSAKILFKSSVSISGYNFGGILLFKKMNDNTVRAILLSELGMTIFDFEIKGNGFKLIDCFEQMKKNENINSMVNTVGTDLVLLAGGVPEQTKVSVLYDKDFMGRIFRFQANNSSDGYNYYYLQRVTNNVLRLENVIKGKEIVAINYQYTDLGRLHAIQIRHFDYDIKLFLKRLED